MKKTTKKKTNKPQPTAIKAHILPTLYATAFCLFFAIAGYYTASRGSFEQSYTSLREAVSSEYNNYHFFLHIPKTGTSGLRESYGAYYTRKAYTPVMLFISHVNEKAEDKYVRCYDAEKYQHLKFVAGHINFGFHCGIKNYTYSTILRDPVARIWSYYKYFVLGPRSRKNKDLNLEEHHIKAFEHFMTAGFFTIDNGMIRRISGVGTDVPYGKITREHLEMAKKNLREHFIVVGVLEDYRKYQVMIEEIIGAKMNYESYKNKNKMDFPMSNLTEEQIETFKKMNELDYELYDFVKEMSEEIFSKLPESAKKKYEEVKDL